MINEYNINEFIEQQSKKMKIKVDELDFGNSFKRQIMFSYETYLKSYIKNLNKYSLDDLRFNKMLNFINDAFIKKVLSIPKDQSNIRTYINYIKENYGQAYLTPLIINKNVEHLKNVLPYLESLGVLPYVVKSASILTLTLDEIKERKDFVESNNDTLVLQNGRFNSIFGVSRANYKKLTNNKNSITK